MTSCLTSRSISSMRATSKTALRPFSQIALAASFGDHAELGHGVEAACASISNQMRKRVSGDQIAAISGAGVAGDHGRLVRVLPRSTSE